MTQAPDFTLPSDEGSVSLSDYRGRRVVLYFYPRDFTSGCTAQACEYRDAEFPEDVAVLGVSPDPVESHRRFKAEHRLTFPLLADEDARVARLYGAYGSKPSGEGVIRSTFVIGPDGEIVDAAVGTAAQGDAARVLEKLRAAQ